MFAFCWIYVPEISDRFDQRFFLFMPLFSNGRYSFAFDWKIQSPETWGASPIRLELPTNYAQRTLLKACISSPIILKRLNSLITYMQSIFSP